MLWIWRPESLSFGLCAYWIGCLKRRIKLALTHTQRERNKHIITHLLKWQSWLWPPSRCLFLMSKTLLIDSVASQSFLRFLSSEIVITACEQVEAKRCRSKKLMEILQYLEGWIENRTNLTESVVFQWSDLTLVFQRIVKEVFLNLLINCSSKNVCICFKLQTSFRLQIMQDLGQNRTWF